MNRAVAAYKSLPRAGRWFVWALVCVAAYFGVVEPVIDRASGISARADAAAAALVAYDSGRSTQDREAADIRRGLRQFGPVLLPGEPGERSVAFNRRITEILDKQGVKYPLSTVKTASLGAGPLDKSMPAGQRVERLIRDVQFDATPEQVSAVLAELERSPEVASVSRVQIRRAGEGRGGAGGGGVGGAGGAGGRTVRANITVEGLVIARKDRAG